MRKLCGIFTLAIVLAAPSLGWAHFPWLALDKDGHAILFFGEGLTERNYHLPPSIAKAELVLHAAGSAEKLKMAALDQEDFVGLRSVAAVKPAGTVATSVLYGDYHGVQLIYYAQHLLGDAKTGSKETIAKQKLQAIVQASENGGVACTILWDGQPLQNAEVTLFCQDGHEEGKAKTDASGSVTFSDAQVEDGLNAILVGHTIKDGLGEDAKAKEAHYLTATFNK